MIPLRVEHEYRVLGRPWGGSAEETPTEYERLVYVGTMLFGSPGAPVNSLSKTEVFWWRAQKHHFVFKPGNFEAEGLSTL